MERQYSQSPDAASILSAIVDSSDDVIVGKTLDGIITSWNRSAERIFGYTAEEAIGQHINLIIPPELHSEEEGVLARVRRGEKVDHFETVRQTKDGRRLNMALTISPIKNAAGQIIGASKVARDITERKRAEEIRNRLSAIVDSSDDIIVGKTLGGIITSWNRSAERIFGYTEDEAIGRHINLIIPPELHSEEEDVLSRLRRGEKVDHFETVRQTKDGRRLDISLTVSPIKNAAGQIIGASKVARDVTKQKQADKEREELLVRERAAHRQAQEADRVKDEFLAVLSHELRTPLMAIVGWTTLLVNGKLDEAKARRAYETILRNAQAQDQLINDLLDVSRIVSGRLRLNLATVDLESALRAAIDVVRPAANAKGIRLEVLVDPGAGPLTGDPDRLQQVFWNLLSNAIKFTPKGGRVQARLQRINSHIEVIVCDTGIGINSEAVPHIFERFRQGDAGVARQYGGLGLGLAIVRHLVELHGGTVIADSPGEGQGSIFTVRLPIMIVSRRMDSGEQVHPAAGSPIFAATGPRLQGLRVLVVDDEADTREIISLILSQAEAEVRVASDAAEAIEILDHWRPDVLVSDIGMPTEDGYAFIRRVRERSREAGGQIPAVALTAYARMEDRLRVLSSGYQMHVPKPVQALELVTVVANIANRW